MAIRKMNLEALHGEIQDEPEDWMKNAVIDIKELDMKSFGEMHKKVLTASANKYTEYTNKMLNSTKASDVFKIDGQKLETEKKEKPKQKNKHYRVRELKSVDDFAKLNCGAIVEKFVPKGNYNNKDAVYFSSYISIVPEMQRGRARNLVLLAFDKSNIESTKLSFAIERANRPQMHEFLEHMEMGHGHHYSDADLRGYSRDPNNGTKFYLVSETPPSPLTVKDFKDNVVIKKGKRKATSKSFVEQTA